MIIKGISILLIILVDYSFLKSLIARNLKFATLPPVLLWNTYRSGICRIMSKYPHCSSETVNAIFLPEGKLWPHLDTQRCVQIWLSDHIICFTGQARGPQHPSLRPPMFTGGLQKQRQTQIRNGSLKTTLICMWLKVARHHLSGPCVQLSPD